MLVRFAMHATAAVMSLGSKLVPSAPMGAAQRAVAARSTHQLLSAPSARTLLGSSRAFSAAYGAQAGQSNTHGATVVPQAYAYDAAADATNAEIAEVDYDPALANSVRLIGIVGNKKDMKVFERSKLLPFSIGFKPDRRNPDQTEWVNVEVWGPLAERAEQQLQKGDRVAVQGRLKIDRWEDRMTGQKRTAFKLVANSISKVRYTGPMQQQQMMGMGVGMAQGDGYGSSYDDAGSGGAAPWDPLPVQQQQQQQYMSDQQLQGQGQGQGQHTVEELWMNFFENPDSWYDNRENKRNPKAPDFKKKEGGRDAPALWISGRSTPLWVEGELQRWDSLRHAGGH